MSIRTGLCVAAFLLVVTPPTAWAQSKAPGKGVDACTVVSKAEIEQAMGLKLKDGKKEPRMQNPGVLSSCDYDEESGGQVSVLLRRNAAKFVKGTEKAEFEKQGMKLTYTTALGDTAAFIDMMGMGTGLAVFRGDYDYIQLSAMMTSADKKTLPDRLVGLGKLVMDRWK